MESPPRRGGGGAVSHRIRIREEPWTEGQSSKLHQQKQEQGRGRGRGMTWLKAPGNKPPSSSAPTGDGDSSPGRVGSQGRGQARESGAGSAR